MSNEQKPKKRIYYGLTYDDYYPKSYNYVPNNKVQEMLKKINVAIAEIEAKKVLEEVKKDEQANCPHEERESIGLLGKTGDIYRCKKCGKEIDMTEDDDF